MCKRRCYKVYVAGKPSILSLQKSEAFLSGTVKIVFARVIEDLLINKF